MSAPIISKLRVYSSNKKSQPAKNKAHVNYIGKRLGVAINEGMAHGIFGKVGDMKYGHIKDINNVSDYIYDISKKGTHMFRGVISLKEDDALRLGFDNKQQWETMLKENIYVIGEKLDIPPSRLEFVSAVHMDKGHPHLHYALWDSEADVKNPFIHPKIANDIRVHLTKKIYKDEFDMLYTLKNEARDILTSGTNDFFKEFLEPIKDMSDKEYMKHKQELKTEPNLALGSLMSNKLTDSYIDKFGSKLLDFRDKLPKTGRLAYQYLEPELKEEANNLIKELIETNKDFKQAFDNYVKASVDITSLYTTVDGKLENTKKKAEDEILKRLSNAMIENIKELNTEKWTKENRQKSLRQSTVDIISSMFQIISSMSNAKENQSYTDNRDLSKQAKKEYAKRMEHESTIDWEK